MIITSHTKPTTLVGSSNTHAFSLEMSAKAASVLSSTIYKSPILAIVRELSCNALDSHTSAGTTTKPFDIHIPNVLEPWFSIRDYGTGISHQDVLSIYTTYFKSTKTNSNTQIGALGLGSKSPFSYTDTFAVTSWHDGYKSTYVAFNDADGMPTLTQMGDTVYEPTIPSGFEVHFSVAAPDFNRFSQATTTFFSTWAATRPNFTGGVVPEDVIYTDPVMVGRGWLITNKPSLTEFNSASQRSCLIQGNVPYNVDLAQLSDLGYTGDLTSIVKPRHKIAFTCPIGTVNFAPSREELQYNKVTKAALTQMVQDLVADVALSIHSMLQATPTVYGRAVELGRYIDIFYAAFLTEVFKHPLLQPYNSVESCMTFTLSVGQLPPESCITIMRRTSLPSSKLTQLGTFLSQSVDCINLNAVSVHVIVSDSSNTAARVKLACRSAQIGSNGKVGHVYVIKRVSKQVSELEFLKAVDQFLENLGGFASSDVVYSSTLADPPKNSGRGAIYSPEILQWVGREKRLSSGYRSSARYHNCSWDKPTATDLTDPKITKLYVPRSSVKVINAKTKKEDIRLGEYYKLLKARGILDGCIILGVPQALLTKGLPSDWVDANSYIATKLQSVAEAVLIAQIASSTIGNVRYTRSTFGVVNLSNQPELLNHSEFTGVRAEYDRLTIASTQAAVTNGSEGSLYSVRGMLDAYLPPGTLTSTKHLETLYGRDALSNLVRIVITKYPLLKFIEYKDVSSSDESQLESALTTYVKLIDSTLPPQTLPN